MELRHWMESLRGSICTPSLWLPSGIQWKELQNPNNLGIRFAEATDILYPIPCAFILLLLRAITEHFLFRPLGRRIGISDKLRRCQIRNKGGVNQSTKLTKFSECLWRVCCYIFSFTIGLMVLWDKKWFWEVRHCWIEFPYHNMTSGIQLYYLFAGSLYVSFTISQFYDVKRKDFWEMFIHHITTLFLLTFSWLTNLGRVGTLILILHDLGDITLEGAKVAKYAKKTEIANVIFLLFIITWILTRLYYFPTQVIYSINYEAQDYFKIFPMFTVMSYLVNILFCLHLIWSWYISKIIFRSYSKGSSPKDSRSSSESSDDEKTEDHID